PPQLPRSTLVPYTTLFRSQPLHADAGFLFDVDSDRVAMADESGAPASEEMMLPLLADYLLPRGPGKLVITNLSTTALLEDVAARSEEHTSELQSRSDLVCR